MRWGLTGVDCGCCPAAAVALVVAALAVAAVVCFVWRLFINAKTLHLSTESLTGKAVVGALLTAAWKKGDKSESKKEQRFWSSEDANVRLYSVRHELGRVQSGARQCQWSVDE